MTPPPQPSRLPAAGATAPKRIDLHCHSDASNKAAEAALNAISCPECYSQPEEVYAQAKRRGMDFVTITDHDTICGVSNISPRADVLVGEELTCWFPEDNCKMHVLVYGITPEDHAELQRLAPNIYDVAEYVERKRIAHSVAHPIYRQNDKLERWHLERLLLMFKGFECLNGAHSALHREAFEPVLERLNPQEIRKLAERHGLEPRWPEPWRKARTAGTDDHGLLNIGRTWTEFPPETTTVDDVLDCLREGACQPGGEPGSSIKLAHTFYSVAVRYYTRHIMSPGMKPNLATTILQTIAGERPMPSKTTLAKAAIKGKLKKVSRAVLRPVKSLVARAERRRVDEDETRAGRPRHAGGAAAGTDILKNLFLTSAKKRLGDHPGLRQALVAGLPPLGEHAEMFRYVSGINRDVSEGLYSAITEALDDASFTGLFDSIASILGQQFVLLPYYFAVFHQNKERHLLREITGNPPPRSASDLRVGLFTDTLDDVNGVARFLRDMGEQAQRLGRHLVIHTSSPEPRHEVPGRKNFAPLLSRELPYYSELKLNLPPVLDVLEWADRQQFDVIHCSTPGPMGLCGWLVAKMLRVPVLGTYHTDFPAYVDRLTRDHRVTNGTVAYMKWLYREMAGVFSRSKAYRFNLRDLGVPEERLLTLPPSVSVDKFNPELRDPNVWSDYGVTQPRKLFYCGRVSVEKNLPMLADAFKRLCTLRNDTALVVAGDGPYAPQMKATLAGLPAYFLGYRNDGQLAPLYAGSDLFVFPSRTDTLGQVVMEAQACGLPALVSNEGGPKETVADGVTGLVVPHNDPNRWCHTIDELLNDEPRLQRMSRSAPARMTRFSLEATFEHFWAEHVNAVSGRGASEELVTAPLPSSARA
jgi:glycosyltransferase involved in cell wall biosynthesis/predicted metal-dependent phosphoesterase TrpH